MSWYLQSSLLTTVLLLFVNHMAGNDRTDHLGYPQLRVVCDKQNATTLELPAVPVPVSLAVDDIDYRNGFLRVSDPDNCLPRLFLKIYKFSIYPRGETWNNITFFDCSSLGSTQWRTSFDHNWGHSSWQDINPCPIVAVSSEQSIVKLDLLSCAKMVRVATPVTANDLLYGSLKLTWSKPDYGFKYVDCKNKTTNCKRRRWWRWRSQRRK